MDKIKPLGPGNEGQWYFSHINPIIRASKYLEDGHFDSHRDGAYFLSSDEGSIFTLLIYLNDDFKGGETVFEFELNKKDK
jgi:hypothetical protein